MKLTWSGAMAGLGMALAAALLLVDTFIPLGRYTALVAVALAVPGVLLLVGHARRMSKRLQAIIDAAPLGVLWIDARGRVISASDQAARMLGCDGPGELAERPVASLFRSGQSNGLSPGARRIQVTRRDGSEFPAEVYLGSEQDGGIRVVTVRDISSQRRAEKQLQLYRTAVERSPASIMITDTHANIVFVNDAAVEVSGYAAAELIGQNPRILQSGDMSPSAYREMWQRINSGEEWRGRFHNRKKSGELYWESVSIIPVKDGGGDITHFMAIKEDITRQLEREKELVHAVKMEAAGQLSGGVAHDFNNLLTIISGNLQLLDDYIESDDEELRGIIEDARSATADGIQLIRRLLSFSRKKQLKPEQHDIKEFIMQSGRLLRRMLSGGIELVIEEPEEPMSALVDLAQFESALINLCANAQDAMGGHGTIVIRIGKETFDARQSVGHAKLQPGEYVVVSVTDDGRGMDRDTVAHACEPFFTTKGAGKGSGLGLSMVYAFATESGGGLAIDSAPDQGTTVSLYFPRTDSADMPVHAASVQPELAGGPETILVVEDNELVRKFASRSLKGLGYRVLSAVDAAAAEELLESEDQVDLLFTDIVMPGETDGQELARWARDRFPGLKIVLTTGLPQGVSLAVAEPCDALPLVKKPYSTAQLASTIRAVLDSD